MSSTKNDIAWEKLFKSHNILSEVQRNRSFEISAAQINQVREARLMTKFDHKINLPKIFTDNKLSILPITRGSYVISQFETYKKFAEIDSELIRVSLPEYLQSIDYENINSEAMAINCSFVSGILADFVEDEELLPTVSGRMGSSSFSFNIRNMELKRDVTINVKNSQIEIDGGYEGLRYLTLLEAKNAISDDFLVRQLYYPYRLWAGNVAKRVKPVFMVYSNGVYYLYEYQFENVNNYNSLALIKQKRYSIEAVEITLEDILQIMGNIQFVTEPEIAFPQADNFNRIINLCELLFQNEMTKDDITTNYDFDPRQTNYYTDAARYLGLIDKKRDNSSIVFYLTYEGEKILKLKYKVRQLNFARLILRHRPYHDVLRKYLTTRKMPSKEEIVRSMRESGLYNIEAESTYKRRASTVAGWINWILNLSR
ncbi:MAG: type II restriction endonuclease [Veillonellales bacterium]